MRNLKKQLKTQNSNGPIYLPHRDFPKTMYDLRDIHVFLQGKFKVVKINSDTQTVHSLYKSMRKFRAIGIQELERRILILSLLYIISFINFYFFSNGVMDGWNLWENRRLFSKKNMEFQVA
jgi:hypothetical protein